MSVLTSTVRCDGFSYTVPIERLNPQTIMESREKFEDFRSKGVIVAESYDAAIWKFHDEAHSPCALSFVIDEIHYKKHCEALFGCTADEYKQAVRVVITSSFGASVSYLQKLCNVLCNMANQFAVTSLASISVDFEKVVQGFLTILPGSTTYYDQMYEELEDALYDRTLRADSSARGSRQLCYYQSYLKFDRILSEFWRSAGQKERVLFFPIYLWWKLTAILPLRPTEFTLIPRKCISYAEGKPFLTVRRTKLKGARFSAEYFLDKDYAPHTYPITDDLASEIEQYVKSTDERYSACTDTLFCKTSQFEFSGNIWRENNGRYTYANLDQLLDRFYRERILSAEGGYVLRERKDSPLAVNEIEKVSLGDARHIAMISLMVSGNSAAICQALAGHDAIEMGQAYYGNVRTFVDALAWERAHNQAEVQFAYFGHVLPVRSLKVKDGACFSSKAVADDFSDCACAVSDEGAVGDCHSCRYFKTIAGQRFSAHFDDVDDKRFRKSFLLYFDVLSRAEHGDAPENEVCAAIEKFRSEVDLYMERTVLEIREGTI